jgi:hypothetical protein
MTCPACLLRPSRPGGVYCYHCALGADYHPDAYDLDLDRRDSGVARALLTRRAARLREGMEAQRLAEELFETLEGTDRAVWALVVEGLGERAIAERIGTTRTRLYCGYLHRLRLAAGLSARPRRYQPAA